MNLVAEHNGILARIREDLPDIGWYLYVTLPSGESRDYLQDTKEIAISQAAEDYGIPASAWQATDEIHVYLRNEGTDVWRPVDAIRLGEGLFKIPGDTRLPDYEDWEFQPGSVVRCVARKLSGGVRLTAIEAEEPNKTEQDGAGQPPTRSESK